MFHLLDQVLKIFVAPLLLIMCVAPAAKRSSLDPSQFEARLLRRGPCSYPLQDAHCGSSVDVQPTENISLFRLICTHSS